MSTSTLIILLLVIAAIAFAAVVMYERAKTRKLKIKFGPEYDRLAQQEGSDRRAEAILESRTKRFKTFNIHPLSREECDRFSVQWRGAQEHFVDDPKRAVADADRILNEVLHARGYPQSDFEEQTADLSVEYPRMMEDYRAAHKIAMEDERGQATTEDLRRAMQHYRNLFEHLLGTHTMPYEEVRR